MGLPLIPTMLSNVLRMTAPLWLSRMDEVRAEDNNSMFDTPEIPTKSNSELKTIKALQDAGWETSDIAALMGNISVETGGTFDPLQQEKDGKGHGIFQLTGKQLKNYKKWLGDKEDTRYTQALFVRENIYGSHGNVPHDIGWRARGMLTDSFGGEGSTEDKTRVFSDVYERPEVPHMDRRIEEALKYNDIK